RSNPKSIGANRQTVDLDLVRLEALGRSRALEIPDREDPGQSARNDSAAVRVEYQADDDVGLTFEDGDDFPPHCVPDQDVGPDAGNGSRTVWTERHAGHAGFEPVGRV